MTARLPAACVILAGGRSSRMGRDKATLRVGSRRLVDLVAARVGPLFAERWIAVGSRALHPPRGWTAVRDRFPGAGPLAGVHAAMRAARRPFLFVVACDMPSVSPRVVRFLWSRRGRAGAVPEGPGGPEPLCAFYARSLLPAIERRLGSGSARSVRALIRLRGVRRVGWGRLRGLDPAGEGFASLNRPQDLRRARAGRPRAACRRGIVG